MSNRPFQSLALHIATAAQVLSFAQTASAQAPLLRLPEQRVLIRGTPSGVAVASLRPGDTVTVEAWRRAILRAPGGKIDTIAFRASGTFIGSGTGELSIDTASPIAGTWKSPSPYALWWSLERRDTSVAIAGGRMFLALRWQGRVVDTATLVLRAAAEGVTSQWVQGDGFAGSFARPAASRSLPAIILLHGSEGGDSTRARVLAESFASLGYAAFAATYFSFGIIKGVPTGLVNVPIEQLDRARAWMGTQADVDTGRTAVWGASKGAELALVVASRRTWPRAVVACVPSDVVWTGFGREVVAGEPHSSWSDGGQPLRYIPYDRYDEAMSGKVTSRAVHDRSRVQFTDSVSGARIPIANSRTPILLLGAERDEVWASGAMSTSIEATLVKAGRTSQATSITYPMAGHGICGTGANLVSDFTREHPTSTPPDAYSTAAAAADAWKRTVAFLRQWLF